MPEVPPLFSVPLVRLDVPDVVSPETISATVSANGSVTVSFKVPAFLFADPIANGADLIGEIEDGSTVKLTGVFLEHSTARMPGPAGPNETIVRITAVKLEISTAKADPQSWTRKSLWLHGPRVFRGAMCWSFGAYDFEIAPHESEPMPGVRPTSLNVRRRPGASGTDFSQILTATLHLLSIVSRVHCRVFLEITYCEDVILRTEATPYPNLPYGTHPLIPPFDLPKFMVDALPAYLRKELAWSLNTLVGYYCRSHQESLVEAKFIFASVFMEALKFTWARNVGQLPQDRKPSGLIRGFRRSTGGNYSFEELMKLVASDLKLNHTYTFIDDRNAMFHSGQAATVQTGAVTGIWPALRGELERLHDQMDEVLLTLLEYSGNVRGFWATAQRLFTPPT